MEEHAGCIRAALWEIVPKIGECFTYCCTEHLPVMVSEGTDYVNRLTNDGSKENGSCGPDGYCCFARTTDEDKLVEWYKLRSRMVLRRQ